MELSLTALPPPPRLLAVLGIEPRALSKHLPLSYPPAPTVECLFLSLSGSPLIAAYDRPSISGNVCPLRAAFSVEPF